MTTNDLVWVVTEHDLDDNASEVTAVLPDDTRALIALLWELLVRDILQEGNEFDPARLDAFRDLYDQLFIKNLTTEDDVVRLEWGEVTWTARRLEVGWRRDVPPHDPDTGHRPELGSTHG